MNTSIETLWREQANRRKRIRNWMLLIVLGFLCLLIVAWALVTQPLLWSVDVTSPAAIFFVIHLCKAVRLRLLTPAKDQPSIALITFRFK